MDYINKIIILMIILILIYDQRVALFSSYIFLFQHIVLFIAKRV